MYSCTAIPPSSSGGAHFTRSDVDVRWLNAGALGAPGAAASVAAVVGSSHHSLCPWLFAARTRARYARPGSRPPAEQCVSAPWYARTQCGTTLEREEGTAAISAV